MPVPWVHRHTDLKLAEIESHIAAYHEMMPELELSGGWHIHFLCRSGSPTKSGLTTPESQDDTNLDKSNQTYLENNSRVRWLSRVELSGQHATANLASLIEVGDPASRGFLSHAYWHEQRSAVDTCALFSVFLI